MGFKSAADILLDEIQHLTRRIERIREEMSRLEKGGDLSPLKTEHFTDRIHALEHEIRKAEEQYEIRKGEQGARHISDFRNGNGSGSLERTLTASQRRWIKQGDGRGK